MAENKVTVNMPSFWHVVIKIDGFPHVTLPNDKLGWMAYIGKDDGRFYIQWSWGGGASFTSDYDDRKLWERILLLMDELIKGRN